MNSQTKTTSPPPHHPNRRKAKRKGPGDESLKVVYISSPMKVRTSVARFRSLVQQLTGKNSDIAPYLDSEEGAHIGYRDEDGLLLPDRASSSVSNSEDTTEDSLVGTAENVPVIMEEQFGHLSFDAFSDTSYMDVLGSYDDLII